MSHAVEWRRESNGKEKQAKWCEVEIHKHNKGPEQTRIPKGYSGLAVRNVIDNSHKEGSWAAKKHAGGFA